MIRSRLIALTALVLAGLVACKSTGVETDARLSDSAIVTTPARSQGATAFCWSYALIAHVEQRYFEQTRGSTSGGFRLDLSEEYLGLIHMMELLMTGQPVAEGNTMSETLDLIDRHGLVPEPIFRAKFDRQLYPRVQDEVAAYRAAKGLAPDEPLPDTEAVALIGKAANLDAGQMRFLTAAMSVEQTKFQHSGGSYTPRTFATNRLKFRADNYFVIKMPSPEEDPAAYQTVIAVIRKALLYGYSLPVSFNYVTGSANQAGVVQCKQAGCQGSALAKAGPTSPHANHATLLLDYRTAASRFGPLNAATLSSSMVEPVSEWVMKNSWGVAGSNSYDPQLLERYPFPSFTILSHEFLQASHRLAPGRYEVIVPRNVCLKRRPGNELVCSELVRDAAGYGVPTDVDTTVDATEVIASQRKALSSHDPVLYDPDAPVAGESNQSAFELVHQPAPVVVNGGTQIDIAPALTVEGVTSPTVTLCMKVAVTPGVRYVAVYLGRPEPILPNPMFVLAADTGWRHCMPVTNTPRKMNWAFQAIDAQFKTGQQVTAEVTFK